MVLALLMSVTLVSCLKDKGFEDGSYGAIRDYEGNRHITIRTAGLNNVQKSSLLINTFSDEVDTIEIFIDLDDAQKTSGPVTVKLSIDNSKVAAYNSANNKNFQTVTSDMVKLKEETVTIPAGERSVRTELYVYQNKFDPAKSYMIPLTITDASGVTLSSNLNTRYFNIIGNPLAGVYNWDFTRRNNGDGSGPAGAGSFTGEQITLLPVTETTFTMESGYFTQPRYEVSFTNTNGVFSNFTVEFNADDLDYMKANGVTVSSGPNIIKADPVTKEFIFQYGATTASGPRYIVDRYYK